MRSVLPNRSRLICGLLPRQMEVWGLVEGDIGHVRNISAPPVCYETLAARKRDMHKAQCHAGRGTISIMMIDLPLQISA